MTARMTAEQRAEISRANGRRGRGPISAEGKSHSRMNALKHGMTARLPVLPGEDPDAFRHRVAGIVESLAPRNPLELALAEQAALALWKIERGERAEAARVAAAVRAAEAHAEDRRREELHALGRWLLADSVQAKRRTAEELLPFLPEDRHPPFRAGRGEPLVILLRIRATAEGCRWLLDRWIALGAELERKGDWDIEELIEAAQLRGERPLLMETSEWECLLQPRQVASNPALLAEGRRQLLDQLIGGPAADRTATAMALGRLVEEEVGQLEALLAAHQRREAAERAELADRLAVDVTAEGERVRRYQLDCDRKLHRALQGVLKLRRGEGMDVGDEPAPEGVPEPESEGTVAVPSGPAGGPGGEADPAFDSGAGMIGSSRPTPDRLGTAAPGPGPCGGPVGARDPVGERPDAPPGVGSPAEAAGPADPRAGASVRSAEAAGPHGLDAGVSPDPERPLPAPDAAEPARAEIGAPAGPAAGPGAVQVSRRANEPDPRTAEGTPENEPGLPAAERAPRNEPGLPIGGDPASRNEPAGPRRIAGLSVPALVSALVMLLAAGLSAAFAVAIGRPSKSPAARAGPDARVGPLSRRGSRLDGAGDPSGPVSRNPAAFLAERGRDVDRTACLTGAGERCSDGGRGPARVAPRITAIRWRMGAGDPAPLLESPNLRGGLQGRG